MHVVITGANRGIGRSLYDRYCDRGDEVTGTARSADGFVPLDVTQPDQFANLARAQDGKPVDLLICNAGVYLDTFTFQAPRFYESLGYVECGRLPAVRGHAQRLWFAKALDEAGVSKV